MFLIDYIILFSIVISVFFGILRGFFKELISSFFWFFNFYFFNKYYYFNSFYIEALQNIFFKNKFALFVIFFFYKKILNYFSKKIIKKIKFSYLNIILGGLFGTVRGFLLVSCFLLIFKYLSKVSYNYYIQNSILIAFFLKLQVIFEKLSTFFIINT